MTYEFSWTWFGIGFLILLAGAALTVWYRQIADNLGSGVSSYERYKLWGLIGCGIGLLTMLNPVSYTHLDVYKRQVLYRALPPRATTQRQS